MHGKGMQTTLNQRVQNFWDVYVSIVYGAYSARVKWRCCNHSACVQKTHFFPKFQSPSCRSWRRQARHACTLTMTDISAHTMLVHVKEHLRPVKPSTACHSRAGVQNVSPNRDRTYQLAQENADNTLCLAGIQCSESSAVV